MPKPRYKTTNWKQYNKALINRGSLTFWIDEEVIADWKQNKQGKRGRPRRFSDLAITTTLIGEMHFLYLLRQTLCKIIEISGDGAYDTRNCYDAIRIKRSVPLIPPREVVAFCEQGHPRNLAVGCQKLYGSNKKWKK